MDLAVSTAALHAHPFSRCAKHIQRHIWAEKTKSGAACQAALRSKNSSSSGKVGKVGAILHDGDDAVQHSVPAQSRSDPLGDIMPSCVVRIAVENVDVLVVPPPTAIDEVYVSGYIYSVLRLPGHPQVKVYGYSPHTCDSVRHRVQHRSLISINLDATEKRLIV